MVGLVIVSHSRALASAVVALVEELSVEKIPLAVSGGIGDEYGDLGTDATDVMDAIESVYSDDGVLILADMGSALLSSDMALEFLSEDMTGNIRISAAPLVEGAVAAAVQIGLHASLDEVCAEAERGLMPKQAHLGTNEESQRADAGAGLHPFEDDAAALKKMLIVENLHGLHARPLTKLVQTAGRFSAEVGMKNVTKNTPVADARSLTGLSLLQAARGDTVMLFVRGSDARAALDALEALHNSRYGEDGAAETVVTAEKKKSHKKQFAVSEGYALGSAYIARSQKQDIPRRHVEDTGGEETRFRNALDGAKAALDRHIASLGTALEKAELDIFYAQKMLLDDPGLVEKTLHRLAAECCNAEYAWYSVCQATADEYAQMNDEYFRRRAVDVIDAALLVLEQLDGRAAILPAMPENPSIIFAKELSPRYAALFTQETVLGVVTEHGGATSHAAIIVRALGIPFICGFTDWDAVYDTAQVIVDGFAGTVHISPDAALYETYEKKYTAYKKEESALKKAASAPAVTKDGQTVTVLANIGSLVEAARLADTGADGVGLLRTEFVFLDKDAPPSEQEQYTILRGIFEAVGKPVTVRTLDIGGDKPLPYLHQRKEDNPFLGVRGVRLYAAEPEIFTAHIRAILRAAQNLPVKIMFPMIATTEDFITTKAAVTRIHAELLAEHVDHAWPIPIGTMIETPAAAVLTAELARECSFFSIGTNDLTQYIMAAERGNSELTHYANPLHPAVLSVITHIIQNAGSCPVSLCGEPGPLDQAIPALCSCGLRTISVAPAQVPQAKQQVRRLSLSSAAMRP